MDNDSKIKQENDSSAMETADDTDESEEFEQMEELPPPFVELVNNLDSYESPIPDALTTNILQSAGVETDDPRVIRLISLCTHKFIVDILSDALQHAKSAQAGGGMRKQSKEKKYTLTPEDLEPALRENGVHDIRAPYHL